MERENKLIITANDGHNFKFNWSIPNFKNIPEGKLYSPLPTSDKCNLKLQLILKVSSSGPTKKLRIGLSQSQPNQSNSNVFFYFEFCNFQGEIFFKDSLEFRFSQNDQDIFSEEITKPTRSTAEPNSARHVYHVTIKGHVVVKRCCQIIEDSTQSQTEAVAQLQQDLEDSFRSGDDADIELVVGEEVFRAHKFVLCARSPVFRRMFSSDFSESSQNKMRIEDINSAILRYFLTFLYSGKIERLSFDSTCELYSVGDKYEVETLVKVCRTAIISYLSDTTVSRTLKLADMHNDRELENKAVVFICRNFKTVAGNDDWKTLILDSPLLVSRTLQTVSNYISI